MKLIPNSLKQEINKRISSLIEIMKKDNTEALLVAFNSNIYYLSGRFFRGYIYISIYDKPLWYVIKPDNFEKEEDVESIRKPEMIPDILLEKEYRVPDTIGLEFDDLSYSTIVRLEKLFPESRPVNGSSILKRARMIKTDWEIKEMKADGIHHCNVYSKIKECYKPGMSDLDLQIEIEKELRLEGSLGISRVSGNLMDINMGSVISGDNADNPSPYEFTMGGEGVNSSLPVGANNSPIMEGSTVMIDMNGAFNGYQTDMTRIWSLGDVSELTHKAHDCSIKILRTLEKMAVPGTEVSSLYNKAIEIVKEDGLLEFFMGHNSQVGFIGHGIGIELNELPVINAKSKDIIAENMTFALEPKFVIPHVGAVGVENTYLVTQNGLVNLTPFPEEIEKF